MPSRPLLFCGITAVHPTDRAHYQPLCFAYLAAYARRHELPVRVIVAATAAEAVAARPDVIGVSASSVNWSAARRLGRTLRDELGVPVLAGGPHISALPETLPPEFAAAVLGEGEETFRELLTAFAARGRWPAEDLPRIAGLAYRDGATVRRTPPRPPIADLAAVPPPDRSVFPDHGAQAHLMSSRGCPYNCRFCSSRSFWGGWRAFPVATVLAEVEDLVERRGAREIHFFDDLFVADYPRLEAIAAGLEARGYPGRIEFSCAIRAELASEPVFAQLARLGCRRLTFGAESQAPRILRWLKGDAANIGANQRTLDLAQRHGIACRPSFIKGSPGETGDELLATYDFLLRGIRERRIDYFEVHCLTPFPGTAVWDLARARGLVGPEMDFDELRTPWERLYLNEAMPKTSFYFFENLTQTGTRWLGLSRRRLVGLIDISHGVDRLAELQQALTESRFLDEWRAIVFHGDVDPRAVDIAGLTAGGRELLAPYLTTDDPALLFVYLRPEEGIDVDALRRIVWSHFDRDADLTLHSAFRHFAPASPFERSLAVGNQRGLRAGLEAFTGAAGALERLRQSGLRIETYRPDDDPFTPRSLAAHYFAATLARDFRIDRPRAGRERQWAAVEERIVTDAAQMQERAAAGRRPTLAAACRAAWRRLTGPGRRS
ncbi:MAG: B12-binding domain-containing radical SAM protein [Myxococcales bacterium]|nr:B12-binding domain-containing radical SAM protein [Myxococcales bacterium]